MVFATLKNKRRSVFPWSQSHNTCTTVSDTRLSSSNRNNDVNNNAAGLASS
uniref:Uncharacterized protein n=1 Tax=Arundo donax TaxID=35708 RepID=A0A0A9HPT5_ARUDO